MKTKILILISFIVAITFISTMANAAAYDDGNTFFIINGKINRPSGPIDPNFSAYYPSGRLKYEGVYSPAQYTTYKYTYLDENYYGGTRQGRVTRIDVCVSHGPWYTFTYYGKTDSVQEMRYYTCYGTQWTIYKYDRKGEITSIYKYNYGVVAGYSHYKYTYYTGGQIIKSAHRSTVEYYLNSITNSALNTVRITNENYKDFWRTGKLQRENDVTNNYVTIGGKAKLKSVTDITDYYRPSGSLAAKVYIYTEYNPATGVVVKYEAKVTYYDTDGNPIEKQNKVAEPSTNKEIEEKQSVLELKGNALELQKRGGNFTFTGEMAEPAKTLEVIKK